MLTYDPSGKTQTFQEKKTSVNNLTKYFVMSLHSVAYIRQFGQQVILYLLDN